MAHRGAPFDNEFPYGADIMRAISKLLLVCVLGWCSLISVAAAGETDPLFVNLTTDEPHRASMGISFGQHQLERGHPLTIFLNDEGVRVAAKSGRHARKFGEHQKLLSDLMAKGAVVLVCPMCLSHYGLKETDLIPGIKVGSPELTGDALFKGNTRSLSW
jgi:sulfur relay (sulfurtransferase) complex TusBCD TusD component (DsrE family)